MVKFCKRKDDPQNQRNLPLLLFLYYMLYAFSSIMETFRKTNSRMFFHRWYMIEKAEMKKLPNKCIISHIIIYCPMERKLNILWFFFWWYWLCLCWVRNPAFYVISFDYHYCRGNGIMHLPYITYCLLLYKGTTCLLHSLSLFTGCLTRRMICMIKGKIINCMYDLTSHPIVYSSSRLTR